MSRISQGNIDAIKFEIHAQRFHPADSLRRIEWMLPEIERLSKLDEPVQLLLTAWRRLLRCNDEFEHPEDCADYRDAFERAIERLAALETGE